MRICLSLSGGGFRATLFHMGVVRYLRDAHLLEHVTHVCSISGGSVIAAHLLQNWDRYTGSQDEFDTALKELEAFIERDVRGHILRRMPIFALAAVFRWFTRRRWLRVLSRTGMLEHLYTKHLYGKVPLSTMSSDACARPALHVCATNLTNGGMCSFTGDGMSIDFAEHGSGLPRHLDCRDTSIGLAVAASSAFTAFFPPVEIDKRVVNVARGNLDPPTQFLTDGGVYDNLGTHKFQQLVEHQLGSYYYHHGDITDIPGLVEDLRSAIQSEQATARATVAQRVATHEIGDVIRAAKSVAHDDREVEVLLLSALNRVLHADNLQSGQLPKAPKKFEKIRLNREHIDSLFPGRTKESGGTFDTLIVSDAERAFERIDRIRMFGLGAAIRAADSLVRRVSDLERALAEQMRDDFPDIQHVNVRISDRVDEVQDGEALPENMQDKLALVRTDFDRFNALERETLQRHGYCVARAQCGRSKDERLRHRPPTSLPELRSYGDAAGNELRKSAHRRWGLFNKRDWMSYANVLIPVALIVGVLVAGGRVWGHKERQIRDVTIAFQDAQLGMRSLIAVTPFESWQPRDNAEAERVEYLDGIVKHMYKSAEGYRQVASRRGGGKTTIPPSEQRLAVEDNAGFRIVRDMRVLDLSGWAPVAPEELDKRVSRTVLTRVVRVVRESTMTELVFQFQSEGPYVDLHCEGLPYEVRTGRIYVDGKRDKMPTWEIRIDVAAMERNMEFEVRIEAMYWNAFPNTGTEGAGISVERRIDEAAMLVVFSEKRLPTSVKTHRYLRGESPETGVPLGSYALETVSKRAVHLRLKDPPPGYIYEIEWEW